MLNISAWRAEAELWQGISSDRSTQGGSRQWESWKEPPQWHHGHGWDDVLEQKLGWDDVLELLPPMGLLLFQRTVSHQRGHLSSPEQGMFVSFLATLGSPCSLPEHSQGKETVSARSGRSLEAEPWGNSHCRVFCLEVPMGTSVVLRVLILDV